MKEFTSTTTRQQKQAITDTSRLGDSENLEVRSMNSLKRETIIVNTRSGINLKNDEAIESKSSAPMFIVLKNASRPNKKMVDEGTQS